MAAGTRVMANLTFMAPNPWHQDFKPYELLYETEGLPIGCNFDEIEHEVVIEDFRPLKGQSSLDREGFELLDLESDMQYEDFFDETTLKAKYMSEVKALLLQRFQARSVYFHECVIRKRAALGAGYSSPISVAHGDYTLEESRNLVDVVCGKRSASVKSNRFQMLNIWKPLKGPLSDWPLAVCDLTTIDDKDLPRIDVKHPAGTLESYRMYFQPDQRWGYFSRQDTNELLIFKSSDSYRIGTVPHCSFDNPRCPKDESPRESIEIRALVAY